MSEINASNFKKEHGDLAPDLVGVTELTSPYFFVPPSGNTAERPVDCEPGTLRFNTDLDSAEIYKADDGTGSAGWTPVAGGGPSLGTDSIIRTNNNVIAENLTVGPTANGGDPKFTNGMSAGPITINTGFTVTVESGASWSVR